MGQGWGGESSGGGTGKRGGRGDIDWDVKAKQNKQQPQKIKKEKKISCDECWKLSSQESVLG